VMNAAGLRDHRNRCRLMVAALLCRLVAEGLRSNRNSHGILLRRSASHRKSHRTCPDTPGRGPAADRHGHWLWPSLPVRLHPERRGGLDVGRVAREHSARIVPGLTCDEENEEKLCGPHRSDMFET
jgi:hypothetical protein